MAERTTPTGPAPETVPVIRAALRNIKVYDVEEAELILLELGSSGSHKRSLGSTLFSIGCSFGVSLATMSGPSETMRQLILFATGGLVVGGAVLYWVGRSEGHSVSEVIATIRERGAITEVTEAPTASPSTAADAL